MKCACCGKKRKFFESYENLGTGGEVCSNCSDIMYRIHDAVTSHQKEEYDICVRTIRVNIDKKIAMVAFAKWFENDFMKRNCYSDDSTKDEILS